MLRGRMRYEWKAVAEFPQVRNDVAPEVGRRRIAMPQHDIGSATPTST
jgi:hypothetical protein